MLDFISLSITYIVEFGGHIYQQIIGISYGNKVHAPLSLSIFSCIAMRLNLYHNLSKAKELSYRIFTVYIHNDSFPIKSAFLPPFRFRKRNLSELCSNNMHFKLIDMKTKGM